MSTQKRPETGPMMFNDDWTGVFIRGDWCWEYAIMLRELLKKVNTDDYFITAKMNELANLLESSHEQSFNANDKQWSQSTQFMINFRECIK